MSIMAAPTPLRDDSDSASPTADDARVAHREPDAVLRQYTAELAHYADAPDECTIYPTNATEEELVTTWISAQEGSYVSLAEMG